MSLEKKAAKAPANDSQLSDEEELDLEIVTAMAKKMLVEGGGLDVVKSAVGESEDPSSVIGQFFAQLFAQMQESLPQELEISPRVYLAKGGVLEQLLDFLEVKLGLPKEFSDQVWDAVLETVKAAAMAPPEQAQPQGPAAPQPGVPTSPTGAPV
jgi:hypothetical protein